MNRNTRLGLWLFAIYVIIYAAFVWLSAFRPEVMARPAFGTNVAVIYGLALILVAILLAFIYMFLCHPEEAPRQEDER